ATTYSAPASRAARAVSASSTVPAPSSRRSPKARRTARTTSRASGTVMVISTTLTPPSARARATSTSWALAGERPHGNKPQARTRRRSRSLLMRLTYQLRHVPSEGRQPWAASVVVAAGLDGPHGLDTSAARRHAGAVEVHRRAAVGRQHLAMFARADRVGRID